MIRNDREFRTAKAHAEQFRRTLADPSRPPSGVQSKTYRASMGALQRHLDALDTDIDSYQALKSGTERGRLRGRLEDLGDLLVHARTARGWTHRQLADALGVRVEEVAEYEESAYAAVSLTRLLEVCRVLGSDGTAEITLVDLPTRPAIGTHTKARAR